MSRRIGIRPQVRIELLEAAEFYEGRSRGLGVRFLSAFDATIDRIKKNPLAYQVRFGKARRATVRRFPYGVISRVEAEEILILACVHGRRDPAVWQNRL